MLSQFFLLSPRGDAIVSKDYRGDLPRGTSEVFFRNVKFWQGKHNDAPPIFHLNGINYFYVKKNNLYFVFTNKVNISGTYVIELLTRLTVVFKDYCGVLTEESIRSNFVLIYELLDEILDFGYVQATSTEVLRMYVFNEPVAVDTVKQSSSFKVTGSSKTTPSTAVDKPISFREQRRQKNEIFVDLYERISLTFNASGYILNSAIDGCIQMKSYLQGNPPLRLALNEDLIVGKQEGSLSTYGAVQLDDCNFHETADREEWDDARVLNILPPDGEFTVMNYRITSDFRVPFRIFPFFELVTGYRVELIVKIRADIPEQSYGGNVVVQFPVPKSTTSVSCDMGVGILGQTTEYDAKALRVYWRIKKFQGGTEQSLRAKITMSQSQSASVRREFGPINMEFEVPMYNPSGVQVRYLRIDERVCPQKPFRWVRYVTRSSSYVCRL